MIVSTRKNIMAYYFEFKMRYLIFPITYLSKNSLLWAGGELNQGN
jgi:hypothetical protein